MILQKVKIGFLIISLFFVSCIINAQSLEDAKKAYNSGVELVNQDKLNEALDAFLKCVEICENSGDEESVETKMEATGVIPGLQLRIAGQYIENDDYKNGIAALEKTIKYADEYMDDVTLEKAKGSLSKTYMKYGTNLMRQKQLDAAIVQLDKAIELDPSFAPPYMIKGYIYKQKDDPVKVKETLLKSIEVAKASNDRKTESNAVKQGWQYFYKKATDAVGKEDFARCIENTKEALVFSPDNPDILILLVQSYNKEAQYDEAISTADEALNIVTSQDKKLGLHYEMAFAHQAKGESEAACENYKKAMGGKYLDNSKYQVEHILKCDQ